jgi:hypothetical protein
MASTYGTAALSTNLISMGPWKLRESGSSERGDHVLEMIEQQFVRYYKTAMVSTTISLDINMENYNII